ncbi:MAG: helix-hairpin-helix domain-containing protein [Lachnospiraceae bacterium]|nr:helix-hairpin-helix domain-containing protein [Lachnospiraceae bacterium]
MIKKDNKTNKKFIFREKYVCMLCVIAFVLLCGCASERDEVMMTLINNEEAAIPASDSENVTEVPLVDEMIDAEAEIEEESQQVYIYVCGAVQLPGVYRLKQGSRLYEAVELAGGLTGDADENCLNMAREITDGEQVVILTQEEAFARKEAGTYTYPGESAMQETAAKVSGLVNINTATLAELTSVSGIGESRAQAIIDYREQHGSFGSIEDIKKVDGIKDGLFSKIKDKITI